MFFDDFTTCEQHQTREKDLRSRNSSTARDRFHCGAPPVEGDAEGDRPPHEHRSRSRVRLEILFMLISEKLTEIRGLRRGGAPGGAGGI
jgi:hypothetical protein